MAGQYLEIVPWESYLFQANVALNGAAVELYQSVLWFSAQADQSGIDGSNAALFINLTSTVGSNVTISNNGTPVNSVVNVTLTSALTANLPYINSGYWALVSRTTANAVYTLDRGRIAVVPRRGGPF